MTILILGFRTTLFYLGYALLTGVYGFLALFLIPFGTGKHVIRSWIWLVLAWLKICCGIRIKIIGEENKLDSAHVVASNHQSTLETFFLQKEFFPLTTVLKKQLLAIPFFGWGLRLTDPIAIERSEPTKALRQVRAKGVEHLQKGNNLLIFPEGTRMPANRIGSLKRGAVDIAHKAGVPLVPVVHNAGAYWMHNKFLKFPGEIKIIIGKPIDVSDGDSREITAEIQQWMEAQLKTMAP